MATRKKPEKVPKYLVSKGTKQARVLFDDGSEGPIPLGSLPSGLLKLDRALLGKARKDFVKAAVDRLVGDGSALDW